MTTTEPRLTDVARQFVVLFGAIFQVYASYISGGDVGSTAQETRSLILPAGYAFAIWGPIFLLCGIYAVYQALPAQREHAVFRAMGWWSAGAFLANGAWIYAYTAEAFILAQIIITIGFACAAVAYLRFATTASTARSTTVEQYIVAPAAGLLAGWLTAACLVGLSNTLVSLGLDRTGSGAELGGGALVLLGGGIAFFGVVLAKTGPSAAWIAFGAAVIWALVAIVVAQRTESLVTSAAAVVSALLVLAALVGPWSTARSTHTRGPIIRGAG